MTRQRIAFGDLMWSGILPEGAVLADRAPLKLTTATGDLHRALLTAPVALSGAALWRISFVCRASGPAGSAPRIRIYTALRSIAIRPSSSDVSWRVVHILGGPGGFDTWIDGARAPVVEAAVLPTRLEVVAGSRVGPTSFALTDMQVQAAPNDMIDLFDGRDMAGWEAAGNGWRVLDGLLSNGEQPGDRAIRYALPMGVGRVDLAIRLRVLAGLRPRVAVVPDGCGFGNEGSERRLEVIGLLANVKRLPGARYELGRWYVVRVTVDAARDVALIKDGEVVGSARLTRWAAVQVAVSAGDAYSAGRLEIAYVRMRASGRGGHAQGGER